MPKIFFLIFIFFFFFLFPGNVVYAQTITLSPPALTARDENGIDVTITGLKSNTEYTAKTQRSGDSIMNVFGNLPQDKRKPDPSRTLSFKLCANFAVEIDCSKLLKDRSFKEGNYQIWISEVGKDTKVASASFSVTATTSDIEVTFTNTGWTPADNITVKLDKVSDAQYLFYVDNQDPEAGGSCVDVHNGSIIRPLGQYYKGSHTLTVYDVRGWVFGNVGCNKGSRVAQRTFRIAEDGSGGPGPVIPPQTKLTINLSDVRGNQSKGELCNNDKGLETAIGCVPTDPTAFVQGFLKLAVGAGGGIALLIMVFGAFRMITSAGNPDSLKEGHDMFINAVIGLLFVIFSTLLLKIIGVDILGLGRFLGI